MLFDLHLQRMLGRRWDGGEGKLLRLLPSSEGLLRRGDRLASSCALRRRRRGRHAFRRADLPLRPNGAEEESAAGGQALRQGRGAGFDRGAL